MRHLISWIYRWFRNVLFAALSPVLEKNPTKCLAVDAPVVFSMSRCIVALFAWGLYWQIRKAGIVGWPEATLCIALAYALPILTALDNSDPASVLQFGTSLFERFGVGDIRKFGTIFPPSDPETKVDRSEEAVPVTSPKAP